MSRLSALLFALMTLGCEAADPNTDVAPNSGAIVDGVANMDPSVVWVYNAAEGGMCSGTLIAPRVVLTAKHCVQESGASGPNSPSSLYVGFGNTIDFRGTRYQAEAIWTTPGAYTSGSRGGLSGALVNVDVAVITLRNGITSVMPKPYRRDSPRDQIGRTVKVVGYGQTPSGRSGTKYETTVQLRTIMGNDLYYQAGICSGDSGGPMIQMDTGEVIGVASFGNGTCGSGTSAHNRIDPFIADIDRIVRETGTCLRDGEERCDGYDNDCNGEVDEVCTPLGSACTANEECQGINCQTTTAGQICTQVCDPLSPLVTCPMGMHCSADPAACTGFCVPGGAGEKLIGQPCTADSECASAYCIDPGDGNRRCLQPCRGDGGMCLGGESCVALPGQCGGCVEAARVSSSFGRGLGEPCTQASDCGSNSCLDDSGAHYCTRACSAAEEATDCGRGFHCRDLVCVRGSREGIGGRCVTSEDCADGGLCVAQGDNNYCTTFCPEGSSCPDGFECVDVDGTNRVCQPDLGLVGDRCMADAGCLSGMCLDIAGAGNVCTRACSSEVPCTTGFECRRVGASETPLCVPASVARSTPPGDGGGCAVTRGAQREAPFRLLALAGLAAAVALLVARRKR